MLLFSSFPSNYSLLVKRDWFCWCRLNNPIGTLIKEVVKLDRLKSFLRFMRTFFLYGRKPNQADKLCHGVHQGKATWQQPGPYWAAMEVDVLTGPWPLFLETSLCSLRSHPSRAILWFICCTVRKNIREKAGEKKKKKIFCNVYSWKWCISYFSFSSKWLLCSARGRWGLRLKSYITHTILKHTTLHGFSTVHLLGCSAWVIKARSCSAKQAEYPMFEWCTLHARHSRQRGLGWHGRG